MRRAARSALLGAAVGLLPGLAPRAALACAVCLATQEESVRTAFIGTTALLTALPPLMVGSFVWWLRRRARFLDRQSSPDAASPPRPGLGRIESG